MTEHAVIVIIPLSKGDMGSPIEQSHLRELCSKLSEAIDTAATGEFDGDEFGGGNCTLYMYGPDADRLFQSVRSILQSSELCRGCVAKLRYGEAGDDCAREVCIEI